MASKVFISHVAEDKELVDNFCELLENGMGVHDIFCSSKDGSQVLTNVRNLYYRNPHIVK